MNEKYRITQFHKNLTFFLCSLLLVGISATIYFVVNPITKTNMNVSKLINSVENSEIVQSKYPSTDEYIKAVENQLLFSLKREGERLNREVYIIYGLFKILLLISTFQFIILFWPLTKKHSS